MIDILKPARSHASRVLVIGKTGQLARALAAREQNTGLEVIFAGRDTIDLERPGTIAPAIAAAAPDVVINTAAYTDVDAAETDQATALAVNSYATGVIAGAAAQMGAALLHVSTDYVFDGGTRHPYREDDHPAPINVYGASKLLGEEFALEANPRTAILRTAWLYAPWGQNFLTSIQKAAKAGRSLRVVSDQIGSPTSCADLAGLCLSVARQLSLSDAGASCWGVTHCAAPDYCSRAEFAQAICDRLPDLNVEVQPVLSVDWPTAAPRPKATPLDCTRLANIFGQSLPPWRKALAETLRAQAPIPEEEPA